MDLASTVLDPVSGIVDGLLGFVESVLELMQNALEEELEIPFLTEFYEFITALLGDEEDFTVINGLALLLSIPIVEMWKAATGSAPFSDGTHGLDSPALFQQIFAGAPAPSPAVGAATLAGTGDSGTSDRDRDYSRYGGIVAVAAGMGCALYEMFAWAADDSNPEYEPIPGPKPDPKPESKLSKAIGLGLGAAKFAGSFPVPVKPDDWVWGVKCASWVLGAAQVLFLPWFPKGKLKYGLSGCLDLCILAMIFAADCADPPNAFGWAAHIVSNFSGTVRGFGAAAANSPTLGIGMGSGVVGGLLAIPYLVMATTDGVYDTVNVGG